MVENGTLHQSWLANEEAQSALLLHYGGLFALESPVTFFPTRGNHLTRQTAERFVARRIDP
jgi:hypothetical protein